MMVAESHSHVFVRTCFAERNLQQFSPDSFFKRRPWGHQWHGERGECACKVGREFRAHEREIRMIRRHEPLTEPATPGRQLRLQHRPVR